MPTLLSIAGPATIRTAAALRDQLAAALAEGGEVRLDCAAVDEADITLLQLLISAHRTAAAAGTAFRLDPPPPGLFDLAERAGVALPADLIPAGLIPD